MDTKTYPILIRLGGQEKRYSREFQTEAEYARAWHGVLAKAHGKAEVICQCPGVGDKRLSIHYLSRTDSFYIARYPGTTHGHAPDCRFGVEGKETPTEEGGSVAAVEALGDGTLRIKLEIGLKLRSFGDDDDGQTRERRMATDRRTGYRTRKPATALLGLLHLLWEKAGIARWHPGMIGKRNTNVVMWRVMKAAEAILALDVPLGNVLCVAAHEEDSDLAEGNRQAVRRAIANNERLVVVAPLAKHAGRADPFGGGRLHIAGFYGIPYLAIEEDLRGAVIERFLPRIEAWKQGFRTVAILQAEPREDGLALVREMALMTVSEAWIPLDSMLEGRVEEKLRAERRAFRKPLIQADDEPTLPDFWLDDTGGGRSVPMEVFGMDDEDYEKRKLEKMRYYRDTYGETGWWYWDAVAEPDRIPAFPQKACSATRTVSN
jgi:hypothetical protein